MDEPIPARVGDAVDCIRRLWATVPRMGVILGTGLSQAAQRMVIEQMIPYRDIPHFGSTTALSHQGYLLCGRLGDVPTMVMSGRCHLYEGHGLDRVTLPVRVLAALGAELLVVTNASGGLNPQFSGGDVMILIDHLDFMSAAGRGGLVGAIDRPSIPGSLRSRGTLVPRSAAGTRDDGDCAWCYDPVLVEQAMAIAGREGFETHRGVYVGVAGPNYETRAEYRMFRALGGDAVGMSTIPEVIMAGLLGLRVLALSVVTNVARPDVPEKVDACEVVEVAARAEPHLACIVQGIAAQLPNRPAAVVRVTSAGA